MRRIVLLVLVAFSARAQEITSKVNEYVNAYVDQGRFMGSVLIAKGGKVLIEKGYGMANVELDVPNTPLTKFRLGSITKQFTAAAILQLQEQGKLNVSDPVSKYFPDSPPAWRVITIRHLLTHTSGIPNYTDEKSFIDTVRTRLTVLQLIDTFKSKPLDFEPGAQMKYSNSGYEVLGYIIEKVSRVPYEQYVRKNIFDRLDMEASGYDHDNTMLKNRAAGYALTDGKLENARFIDMSLPYAAGSLYSTVEDLYRWDRGLYTEKLLKKSSIEAMYTPFKNHYAYGWMVEETPRRAYGHGGGIFGFSTYIARYPADDAFVAVLSNIEGAPSGKIAGDLARILFGEKYDLPKKHVAVSLDSKILDRYTGKYQLGPMTFTVTRDGDKLMGTPSGQKPAQLFPESETDFFLTVVDAQITFVAGPDKSVSEMVLHQNGHDVSAKRIELNQRSRLISRSNSSKRRPK